MAIYGPTTSNKMGLALSLSRYIWGKYRIESEVVNADPRKIYKGFIISQSLPDKSFTSTARTHLFGTVSPKNKLSLSELQKLIAGKVSAIQKRKNLPILVGGSSLQLLCVLENWKEGEKKKIKSIPKNTIIFGLTISKPALKKAVTDNVSSMIKNGLYDEFKLLYAKSKQGRVSMDLLNKTLGYRQFLEMARVSKQAPTKFKSADLIKIKKWIIKDILNYAYHQTLDYKNFQKIHLIDSPKQAKKLVDLFIA